MKGTGPGVTWNCTTDGDVANEARDCAATWQPAGFLATRTDGVTLTNASHGAVVFDVERWCRGHPETLW